MPGAINPQSSGDRRNELAERIVRLEEHSGFAERTVEQLSEEIRLLNQRVHDLAKRLDAMEGRLGGVVERVEKVEDQKPA